MTARRFIRSNLSASKLIGYLACGAFLVMPMGTTPFTVLGICILVMWIFSGEFARKRAAYLRADWFLPVCGMIAVAWLGLIWSPEPFGLGLRYAKKTHYWLYALAISSVPFTTELGDRLIKALLMGLFLNCIVAFMQVAEIAPIFSKAGSMIYTGLYSGYNTLGILLVLGMMLASYYFMNAGKKTEKFVYLGLTLVYFVHICILGGRGGYFTFTCMFPAIVRNFLPSRSRMTIFFLSVAIVCSTFAFPVVRERIGEVAEGLEKNLNAGREAVSGKVYSGYLDRIYMWRWALTLLVEHPIIGVGTGGYRQAILNEGAGKGIDHPHNNILYMGVSFGIVGLVLFTWLFWIMFRSGWRSKHKPLGYFVLASGLVIFVGGLTDTHMLDSGAAFLLAVATGLQTGLIGCELKTPIAEADRS